MTTTPLLLPWQAHEAPNYNHQMGIECDQVKQLIENDATFRTSIISDPRDLHKRLFSQFAPASHPEYAGTYRGTVGTSLEFRNSGAAQLLVQGQTFSFASPREVHARMSKLISGIKSQIQPASGATNYAKLLLLTHAFCWFGAIHPFLDGNGHVQRAFFAAIAKEMNIPLSNRFAIHPRSYDSLLAFPLEMFTRSNGDQKYLAMVAEYLSSWLAGPFDAPGSGLP